MEQIDIIKARLKEAVEKSGMSFRGLAEKAGLSNGTVRNAILGGNVTLDTIEAICGALGLSIFDLISNDSQKPIPISPRYDEVNEFAELTSDMTKEQRKKVLDMVRSIKYGLGNKKAS